MLFLSLKIQDRGGIRFKSTDNFLDYFSAFN